MTPQPDNIPVQLDSVSALIHWLGTNSEYGIPIILAIFSLAINYFFTKRMPEERLFLDSDFKRLGVDFCLLAIAFFLSQNLSPTTHALPAESLVILLFLFLIYFVVVDQYIHTRQYVLLIGPFNDSFFSHIRAQWKNYIRWCFVQFVGFFVLVKVLAVSK